MSAIPPASAYQGPAYQGDDTLARLLADAGISAGVPDVRAVLAGVLAAAQGADPDAFLALFGIEDEAARGGALAGQLRALKATLPVPPAPEDGDIQARLARMRTHIARLGLDGFVIPRADEYQGEYVPARSERLAWATGFTGSAGVAVVLATRAAVFVDGRYTLQVRSQVPSGLYEFHHLIEDFHGDWVARALPRGARLGYDARMHTVGWVERMEKALLPAGITLVAVDDNPVDAAWGREQPPAPLGPVRAHALDHAGRTAADKRAEIAEELRRRGEKAAVITQPDNVAWLLNIRGGDVPNTPLPLSFAILDDEGGVELFIDRRKLVPGVEEHLGNQVAVRAPQELGDALRALGSAGGGAAGAKVRVDPVWASVWVIDQLTRAGATVVRERDPCVFRKAAKNPVEQAGMRAAHVRDGVAVTRFLAWFKATAPKGGLDEITASDHLYAMRAQGALFRGTSFDSISGAGPNGAIVHYRATPKSNRMIESDSVYLIDSGAQYLDGTTDITRTLAVGNPGDEARRAFTLVLKGHIALARLRFPKGTTGSQIDVLARQFLWAHGLDYDHGTGHGVGSFLSVHEESTRIAKTANSIAMVPGMVLSNEPGYYKTGGFGIRIENLVMVGEPVVPEGGELPMMAFETLTLAPIDRDLIAPALLTDEERAWLNAYHARVRSELTPLLDPATAAWLDGATAPV